MTMQHPDSESKSFLSSGWVVVLLMALSAAVGQAFGRFSYGVLLPAVRDDMGISNTLAGFIGGANVGAYLVGTLLVSWIAGRYRLLAIMRLGLLMVVAGLFGAAFSATPLELASALGLAGVGGAMLWIPAPVVAADAIPEVGVGCPVVDGGLAVLVGNARVDVPAFFLNEHVFTLV